MEKKFNALRKGLLELAVLKLIASEKLYAATVLQRLAGTPFATKSGTLYPLLAKLQRDGLVAYEWAESKAGPPRKYYQLTDLGRTHVYQMDQYWQSLADTLAGLK